MAEHSQDFRVWPAPLTDAGADAAREAAGALRVELSEQYGITGHVHAGFGVAFVSVEMGPLVWSDGYGFWWASGRPSKTWDPDYAFHDARDIVTAARRVALRFEAVRLQHPDAH